MPHDNTLPALGSTFGGKYSVVRLLGTGGMGSVFEVEHIFTKKRFALKWMAPELAKSTLATERFAQEARLSCAIEHPNIVDVFDVCFEEGAMFLVMELLRGEPLSERLERDAFIDPVECVSLLLPVLHGLGEAHEMGIIHRDLKPENLFLAQARPELPIVAKLLDFGISKAQRGAGAMHLTATGMMLGTAHYMAPEQARDASTVGAQADVYSFGVMLYEALCGQLPFNQENLGKLLTEIVLEPAPDIREHAPHLPAALCDVVMRTLAKDPRKRPAGARGLGLELCAALGLDPKWLAPSGTSWPPSEPARLPSPERAEAPSPRRDVSSKRLSSRARARLWAGLIVAVATAVATSVNVFS